MYTDPNPNSARKSAKKCQVGLYGRPEVAVPGTPWVDGSNNERRGLGAAAPGKKRGGVGGGAPPTKKNLKIKVSEQFEL